MEHQYYFMELEHRILRVHGNRMQVTPYIVYLDAGYKNLYTCDQFFFLKIAFTSCFIFVFTNGNAA